MFSKYYPDKIEFMQSVFEEFYFNEYNQIEEIVTKDYRKKKNLKWFNDNYFIAVYNYYDDNIDTFENIEEMANKYRLKVSYIFAAIRKSYGIEIYDTKHKIYVYKKTKINENYKRTK